MNDALKGAHDPGVVRASSFASNDDIATSLDDSAPHGLELLRPEEGKCSRRVAILGPVVSMVLDPIPANEVGNLVLSNIIILVKSRKVTNEELLQLRILQRFIGEQ